MVLLWFLFIDNMLCPEAVSGWFLLSGFLYSNFLYSLLLLCLSFAIVTFLCVFFETVSSLLPRTVPVGLLSLSEVVSDFLTFPYAIVASFPPNMALFIDA